jgi:hypothetical protein
MNTDPLQILCEKLKESFGASLKNYGEAIKSLNPNQAANYITVDNSQQCAIDDTYSHTLFYVRESADVLAVSGGGTNQKLTRSVTYRLAANTRNLKDEYSIIRIINSIPKLTYNGTSYDQDGISATYYGIAQRNTDSAFFTVSFSVLETIYCKNCN